MAFTAQGPVTFGPHVDYEGVFHPDIRAVLVGRDDPGAVGTELDESWNRQFQEQFNEVGSGQITLDNADPDTALLTDDSLIRFEVRGRAAFCLMPQEWNRTWVSQGEEADYTTELSGVGHLAILEEAVVQPSRGFYADPPELDRVWGWASYDYDDSHWTNAASYGPLYADSTNKARTAWLDNLTERIWAPGYTDRWAPGGSCYFRQRFFMEVAGDVMVHAMADDTCVVYVDGQELYSPSSEWEWTNQPDDMHEIGPYPLDVGWHVIAIEARNSTLGAPIIGGGPYNPAWLCAAAYRLTEESEIDKTRGPLLWTNNQWKIVAYPEHPPGMTMGEIIRHAIEEGAQRTAGHDVNLWQGSLYELRYSFTDEVDSNGMPWEETNNTYTKVGNDLLTFLRELAAADRIDFSLDPASWTLNVWNKGGRGRALDTVFHGPTDPNDPSTGNLLHLSEQRRLVRTTAILAHYGGYKWLWRTRGPAPWREGLLELGAVQTEEEAIKLADSQLDIFANTRSNVVAEIDPMGDADRPYVGVHVGDSVMIPNVDGSQSRERIIAMTVAEDTDGNVSYSPELRDPLLDEQERMAQSIKKMANGTLGGETALPTPLSQRDWSWTLPFQDESGG